MKKVALQTEKEIMRVKKLSDMAILPKRGSKFAAGFDLASAVDIIVPARGKALVGTDLAISLPEGCYARVAPRSGLAWKKSIDTGAGVIDADYTGSVGVILFNHSDVDFKVSPGDRIAQLILERISYAEAALVDDIAETARGPGGFGSTGVSRDSESPKKKLKTDIGQPEGEPLVASLGSITTVIPDMGPELVASLATLLRSKETSEALASFAKVLGSLSDEKRTELLATLEQQK